MRRLVYSIFLLIFLIGISFAQDKQDPFQGHYNVASSDEIALFWNNSGSTVKHQIFDYYGNSGQYFLDSSARGTYTGDLGSSSSGSSVNQYYDAITGDFNGDGLDNIVAAWKQQTTQSI